MSAPRPVRVGILYDRPLALGGVETHLASIFRCADPTRYDFVIIAPAWPAFEEAVQAGRLRARTFSTWQPPWPGRLRALVRLLREEQIDLVHAHSSTAGVLGRAAARLCKMPAVATVHLPVTEYHGSSQAIKTHVGRQVYILLDRLLNHFATRQIIFVARSVMESCVRSGLAPAGKSKFIPNGIDLSAYRAPANPADRLNLGVLPGELIISFVGRLDEQKGVNLLLTAFAGLVKERPGLPARLWLVGDGPLRTGLQEQANQLRIAGPVNFWGYQNPVAPFLRASDLFALPSRYEAMPIALVEALAAGLPCLVTDVGDNARLVGETNAGLVVPPNDAAALQAALLRLVDDPALRREMSARAVAVRDSLDEQLMARRIQAVYEQALRP